MKRYRLFLLLLCLLLLSLSLGACVAQDSQYMRRDINTLQNQIDDLQQDMAGLKSPRSSEAVVTFEGRKGQADMEAELERLRIDLNNVNARIEDSQYLTTRLSGRLDSLETNLSTRIDGLEAKLDRTMAMGETTETAPSEPQPAAPTAASIQSAKVSVWDEAISSGLRHAHGQPILVERQTDGFPHPPERKSP